MHCSLRRLLWRGLEFYVCTINKSSNTKNLETYLMILVYIWSSVSSTETHIDTWLAKAWPAYNSQSVLWKSDLTDKMKRSYFPGSCRVDAAIWTLNKRMEKKLDGNYTRMLWAILNNFWKQQLTKQQLYGHLSAIMEKYERFHKWCNLVDPFR